MPNIVAEHEQSPDLIQAAIGDRATFTFNVYDMTDPFVAHLALTQQAPAIVMMNSGKNLVPVEYRITGKQDNFWRGVVAYDQVERESSPTPLTDETRLSFTIGAKEQHVEKSLETIISASRDPDSPPPDFNRAVNVTRDAVEGADILVPEFTFEITKYVPLATITNAWVKQVADLVGTVADAPFKTFPKGEILLTSVSGTNRSTTDAEITYQFARQKNAIINVPPLQYFDGNQFTMNIPKLGWELVWIWFTESKDAPSKRVIKIPHYLYVERMYEFGDYSILGL